jgi:nitrite reductase/ring-hydroxylating ferredoxin subunit
MSTAWTQACTAQELPAEGSSVFKKDGHQIAIFRTTEGAIYAVDNRCPHEGYPLAQGTVSGCVLTCSWHNYKFDLRDGACVMGEEAVRSFPVREVGGHIEVDLSPPDPALEQARLWQSMDQGMHEHRMGRVARDVVRLIQTGVAPTQIAAYGACWDATRAEYGPGHPAAVAADVCRYLDRYTGTQAAFPLVQALDMSSFSSRRLHPRVRPEPLDPGHDVALAGTRFRAMVEAEDAAGAEGLMRGALAAGWGPDVVLPWMFQVVGAHFLDFGHQLIFLTKAVELLARVGWAHADPLVSSLCCSIVNSTREDLLPDWSSLSRHLETIEDRLPALYRRCTQEADPDWAGGAALTEALLDGRRDEVFSLLTEALEAGAPICTLIDVLSQTAAHRMLRFDVAHDQDPGVQDSWLSVTHNQTFAAAIRVAAATVSDPCIVRMLFHGARFIHTCRALDSAPADRLSLAPTEAGDLDTVLTAIAERRSQAAVGMVAAWMAEGTDLRPLELALLDLVIRDPLARPIVVAHAIKNTVVGFEEHRASSDPAHVLAVVRLLSSPIQERRIHQVTGEAIAFVTEGKVPRVLA